MSLLLMRRRRVVPFSVTAASAFDNAAWTKSNTTIDDDAETAPDGSDTADKIIASATTSSHFVRGSVTVTPGIVQASVSLKVGEITQARFILDNGSATIAVRTLDLTTGAIVGGIPTGNGTIVAQPDGWWRVTLWGYCSTTTARVFVNLISAGAASFLGDDASGCYAVDVRVGRVLG